MLCMTSPSINFAFATFHLLSRKRLPQLSGHSQLQSLLYLAEGSSNESPSESTKDWFLDGREVARQLKMDLGITSKDDDDDGTNFDLDREIKGKEVESKFDSGRAAARELLKQMMNDEEDEIEHDEGEDVIKENTCEKKGVLIQVDDSEALDMQDIPSTSDQQSINEYFNLPSRKSHCHTICLVPPPSATRAWEQLMAVRKECKDPGYYRWPPHANIVYPFIEPIYDKDSKESKDEQRTKFRNEIAIQLSKAASKVEPFDVTIDEFGTFGGKQRGVLWGYPRSESIISDEAKDEEPLIALHSILEEHFPMCKDQRKGGEYHPHMTVSHYANNDDALAAKEKVMANWETLSFHIPEVYLLERKGDDGQFKIAATIPLGAKESSKVEFHNPPKPFPAMPETEEDWVYNERMEMKSRRKQGNRRTRRRSKKRVDSSSGEEE